MNLNLSLLPNLGSALVVCATFLYVWRISGERHLAIWFLASVVWVVRYSYTILQPALFPDDPFWVIPVLALARGALFLWGGTTMVGERIPTLFWIGVLAAVMWLFASGLPPDDPFSAFPGYVVFGLGLTWVALRIGRHPAFPSFERALAAWPMAIYGLIQLTFPWSTTVLRPIAPTTYLVASLTQIGFILGILMVYLRSAERDVGDAHVRLARALTRALSGHLDMCARCSEVRGASGEWERVETYVSRRSGTSFSHSICPTCLEAHYPGVNRRRRA